MTTIAALAADLDTTEANITTLLDVNPDLWDAETETITAEGVEVITAEFQS